MRHSHQHRPSDTVSAKYKNSIDLCGGRVTRVKLENEATSRDNDLFRRPVYVPSRDNIDLGRTQL